jgi:hypothetical protein
MKIFRSLAAAALTVAALSTPALAVERNIGVGNEITFHDTPINADNYGCFDLGNTQELEQMRTDEPGPVGTRERMQLDQMIVTRYVGAHGFESGSHANVCTRILVNEPYKVTKIFDWPGGGPRLYCLELMHTLDVRSADQVAADEAKGGVEPVCLWVSLSREPALLRFRDGPAPAQPGTITDR